MKDTIDLIELNLKGKNIEDDLRAINSAIEDFALENISEYFWIHRRFKIDLKEREIFIQMKL